MYFTSPCGENICHFSNGANVVVSVIGGNIENSGFGLTLIARPLNYSAFAGQVQLDRKYIEVGICHGHTG